MAAGAGLYSMGVAGAIIILLTLIVLRRLESRLPRRALETWSIRVTLADGALLERLRQVIAAHSRKVALMALLQDEDDRIRLTFSVEMPRHFNITAVTAELRAAGARAITWHAAGDADVEEGP